MKTAVHLLGIAGMFVWAISCAKQAGPVAPLQGKWNVVSDDGFSGIGINNHPVHYDGQPGDYFDFRNNGQLYIKETSLTDTTTYQLTSDSTLLIGGTGIVLNGLQSTTFIENLTAHSVTLHAKNMITPGGVFGRKIQLAR